MTGCPIVTAFRRHSSEPLPDGSSVPSDDAGLSEVRFGSGICISTNGIIGGPEEECGLAEDESGGGAPDSRTFSRDSGEGGSSVLSTRGKRDLITPYLVVVE